VIIGGGFAGLFAARRLRRAPVEVTLIDRSANHVFQPMLYQCATGIVPEAVIAPTLRGILGHHRNTEIHLAEVVGFDLDERLVKAQLPDGDPLEFEYDSLIVGSGVQTSYFGHDEFRQFAPGMKTVEDAREVGRRIFGAFELASETADSDERQALMTFVLVGAGPTGVELSGQIRQAALHTLKREFKVLDPSRCRVVLVDAGSQPLATFGDHLSERAAKTLESMGVELHMGSLATAVDASGVTVKTKDGQLTHYPARTVIWSAGVTASPLGRMLADASGAKTDRAGRVEVLPDCSLPDHPEVFAVGDLMSLNGLPGVAEVAMQSGMHAAKTIRRRLEGKPARPFHYVDLGSMAYVGHMHAVVDFRGIKLSGRLGWLMWLGVHIVFLTGWMNRFAAFFNWLAAAGGARRNRIFSVDDLRRSMGPSSPSKVHLA
jgi:NADH:quinone reductase (non-electrogenic)